MTDGAAAATSLCSPRGLILLVLCGITLAVIAFRSSPHKMYLPPSPQPLSEECAPAGDKLSCDAATAATRKPPPRGPSYVGVSRTPPPPPPSGSGKDRRKGVWLHGNGARLNASWLVASGSPCEVYPTFGAFELSCRCPAEPPAGDPPTEIRLNLALDATVIRVAAIHPPAQSDLSLEIKAQQGEPTTAGAAGRKGGRSKNNNNNYDQREWILSFPLHHPTLCTATPSAVLLAQGVRLRLDVLIGENEDQATSDRQKITNVPTCFASVGDWGSDSPNWRKVSAALTQVVAQRPEISFIASTGDNFYPTGVKSAVDPLFRSVFETPLGHPVLKGMKFLVVAGNHDQWGLKPQITYGETHPRWHFPAPTYQVEVPMAGPTKQPSKLVRVMVYDGYGRDFARRIALTEAGLDTTRYNSMSNSRNLINDDGDAMVDQWRVVLNHAPIYTGAPNHLPHALATRKVLLPSLVRLNVSMYINGDDHILEVHRDKGIDFFVSGGGGGAPSYATSRTATTVFTKSQGLGFMVHCLRKNVAMTDVYDENGEVVVQVETPRRQQASV